MPILRNTNSNSSEIEPTNIPSSLIDKENKPFSMNEGGTKFGGNDNSLNSDEEGYMPPPVIGRTVSDLIFEYINSPRVIIIIFFIISIMFITGNSCIKKLDDLEMPIYITGIITVIWYGLTFMSFLIKKTIK